METIKRNTIRCIFVVLALLIVLYPLYIWYKASGPLTELKNISEIFPAFGLIAFSIMWLHIIGAPFKLILDQYFDFEKFVSVSSKIVLVSLILHPLLLLVYLKVMSAPINILSYLSMRSSYLIWLAIAAWFIFIFYDISKKLKKRDFFVRHWKTVRLISTLAFFLVLIHSLGLGRDLQVGTLRYVWIFYGITALIATSYTYFFSRK